MRQSMCGRRPECTARQPAEPATHFDRMALAHSATTVRGSQPQLSICCAHLQLPVQSTRSSFLSPFTLQLPPPPPFAHFALKTFLSLPLVAVPRMCQSRATEPEFQSDRVNSCRRVRVAGGTAKT
eukprot:364807-Chlamydomonas_euryale.AAC.3